MTARERVRVARRLGELPLLDDALRRGEISYCKVRAMARVATPANEATLLGDARFMTGSQLEKTTRKYASVARHAKEGLREDPERRHVRRRDLDDGMTRIEATLHPDEAELVWAMLAAAAKRRATRDSAESPATFNRADALVDVAQAYLRGDAPARAPVDVVLTLTNDEVCAFGETGVSAETARRLCCDAGVSIVKLDERGEPTAAGRKRRTFCGALKRALLHRDRACTFPGCTNALYLEGHHIKHWIDGGETTLDNAALLCSTHHRYVHEYGFSIQLDDSGTLQFFDARGRAVNRHPSPTITTDLGWATILRANETLSITADTIACGWDGHPIDYGAVVEDLLRADDSAESRSMKGN